MIKYKNLFGEYEFNEKTKELIFRPNYMKRVFKYKGLDDLVEGKGNNLKYDYQIVSKARYGLGEIYKKYKFNMEELRNV